MWSRTSSRTLVGTSGYSYKHWAGDIFYPSGLPQTKWLEYYARSFDSVEINVSFYHLPKKQTFESWYAKTPKDFMFAVKGSRYITHMKKLENCEESVEFFFQNTCGLKEKLGVVLWQLPPSFHLNPQRLEGFCNLLRGNTVARKSRQAFEFRHQSWFCREVYALLRDFNYSLCIAHSIRWPSQATVTAADYAYLRFHGGETFDDSNYSDEELQVWASKARAWRSEGRDIYSYFNNDAYGYAITNALRFRELLES